LDHLSRQGQVGLCPPALWRILDYRLPVDGRLRQPYTPRDDGPKNSALEVLGDLVRDLRREPRPRVVHSEHNPEHVEIRVEHPPQQAQRISQLPQTLQRIVLALDGDEDRVRCREAVHRKQAEGGRAVQQQVVEFGRRFAQGHLQARLASEYADQLHLGP
jgi:hypothetical protein